MGENLKLTELKPHLIKILDYMYLEEMRNFEETYGEEALLDLPQQSKIHIFYNLLQLAKVVAYGQIGANCIVRFKDGSEQPVYISFGSYTDYYGHDGYGVRDDAIFYYTQSDTQNERTGEDELKVLMLDNSFNDFKVISYEIVYRGGY